jgi:hypothetical protein
MLKKLIAAEGCSCGNGRTGETPEALLRKLTASPAESEHPVAEFNYYFLI